MLFFNILIILNILCFFPQPNLSTDDCDYYPWEEDPKVAKCNSTHCDNITKIDWCPPEDVLLIYTTLEYCLRLRPSTANFTGANPNSQFTLKIDPCTTYQTYFGFGGALTDSAAIMISCLPESAKMFLMNNYFNCEIGIGYNMIRMNLGACDFSTEFYTYCDSNTSTCATDQNLTCFNLSYYDTQFKIPLLKLAMSISCHCIHVKGATWNAPKWMTYEGVAPNDTTISYVPQLYQSVLPISKTFVRYECYEAWSNYYLKLIEAFGFCELNCSFILSVGNEPFIAIVSIGFTPDGYRNFLVNYLCPKIRNLNCTHPIKILVNDDQTPFLSLIQLLFLDPEFRSCVDYVGTHWYLDFQDPKPLQEITKTQLKTFQQNNPDKSLRRTESSICQLTDGTYNQSDWKKLEKYLKDIIIIFLSNLDSYSDWNLALDMFGGPNWQKNFCDAAIKINCTKGEFYKKVLFYGFGHIAKFLIPKKSIRADIKYIKKENSLPQLQDDLYYVAFKVFVPNCKTPNIVVIILNTNNNTLTGDICIGDYNCATITIPAQSLITTISTLPCEFTCN